MRVYCVYMLASRSRVLYIGVTSRLKHRVGQHKVKLIRGFTAKYNVDRLVWFEVHESPMQAIAREKALKRWRREKKVKLIEISNPEWRELYDEL